MDKKSRGWIFTPVEGISVGSFTVKKMQPLDFLSTVRTNKMLYDIPGMVLLPGLTAV